MDMDAKIRLMENKWNVIGQKDLVEIWPESVKSLGKPNKKPKIYINQLKTSNFQF